MNKPYDEWQTAAACAWHRYREEDYFAEFSPIVERYIRQQRSERPFFTNATEHLALKMADYYANLRNEFKFRNIFIDYINFGIDSTNWKRVAEEFLQRFYPELVEDNAEVTDEFHD